MSLLSLSAVSTLASFTSPAPRIAAPPTMPLRSTAILTVPTHLLAGAPRSFDLALIMSPTVGSTLGHSSAVVLP